MIKRKMISWLMVAAMGITMFSSTPVEVPHVLAAQPPGSAQATTDSSVEIAQDFAWKINYGEDLPLTAEYFPDEEILTYVKTFDGNDETEPDGKLSQEERDRVKNFVLDDHAVLNASGIQYFTELTHLDLSYNPIKTLDLSYNIKLEYLSLQNCDYLTSVNLSDCSELNHLSIGHCQLGTLDVTHNEKLISLSCDYNPLTALDLHNNSLLQSLNCNHTKISELSLSNLTQLTNLNCGDTNMTQLDLSSCKVLSYVYATNSELQSIIVKDLTELSSLEISYNKLSSIDLTGCTKLNYLRMDGNLLRDLDLSPVPQLRRLSINDNEILSLDTSHTKYLRKANEYETENWYWRTKRIETTLTSDGEKYVADLSGNPSWNAEKVTIDKIRVSCGSSQAQTPSVPTITQKGLEWDATIFGDGVEEVTVDLRVDISNGYNIQSDKYLAVSVAIKKILVKQDDTYVDINEENFPDENFRKAISKNFDGDGDGKFQPGMQTYLDASGYEIKDFTGLAYFTAADNLSLSNNSATSIDLSKCIALRFLDVSYNQLTSLDVSGLQHLDSLHCSRNQLTSLDVSQNSELRNLSVSDNQLTSLDFPNHPNLTSVYCSGNQIRDFSFLKQVQLTSFSAYSQKISIPVKQQEDGTFVAYDSLLLEIDIDDTSSFYSSNSMIQQMLAAAKVTDQGWEWASDPFSGSYKRKFGYRMSTGCQIDGRDVEIELEIILVNEDGQVNDQKVVLSKENFPDDYFRQEIMNKVGASENAEVEVALIDQLGIYNNKVASLQGIELLTELSDLSLYQCKNLTSVDLSNNTKLTTVSIDQCPIHSLDLNKADNLSQLNIWNVPLTSMKLSEKSNVKYNNYSQNVIKIEAVQKEGKYVLDLPDDAIIDAGQIFDASEDMDENGFFSWDSLEDIPLSMSYSYRYRESSAQDDTTNTMTVNFYILNNAPELPQAETVTIDEEHFPDAGFRGYLKAMSNDNTTLNTANFSGLCLGRDAEVNGQKFTICSLKGLEYLTGLTTLSVYGLPLAQIDLSKNVMLTDVTLSDCALTSINIQGCPYLEKLSLNNNSLTTLDLSSNQYLRRLDVNSNSLTGLNLSQCSRLRYLAAESNSLTALDLSAQLKLKELYLSYNSLKSLSFAGYDGLTELSVAGNSISNFNETLPKDLTVLRIDSNNGLIKTIDLSECTKLQDLNLQSLTVKGDLSQCKNLKYVFVWETEMSQTSLDFTGANSLQSLHIVNCGIEAITLKGCQYLNNANLSNNSLKQLDVSDCPVLATVCCDSNQITVLSVKNDLALKELNCDNNQLEVLDVSDNVALQTLYCNNNNLATIDTKANKALKHFGCDRNPIVSLDLSQNAAMLESLNCNEASLTSLDVSDNQVLEQLSVDYQVSNMEAKDFEPGTSEEEKTTEDSEEPVVSEEPVTSEGPVVSGGPVVSEEPVVSVEPAVSIAPMRAATISKSWTVSKTLRQGTKIYQPYILNLSKNGSFDPTKITGLSCGKAVDKGILFDSSQAIPTKITYQYSLSNDYKIKDKSMPVTIYIDDASEINASRNLSGSEEVVSPSPSASPGTDSPKPTGSPSEEPEGASPSPSASPGTDSPKPTGSPSAEQGGVSPSPSKEPEGEVTRPTQTPSLNKTKATLYTTKLTKLQLKVDAASEPVKWSSSNKKIATVNSSGKVTAKKAGKAIITASIGATKLTCTVQVKKPKISVKKTSVSVKKGKKKTLSYSVTPKGASVKVKIKNKKIVKYSKSKLIGLKKGKTTVILSCGGTKKTITVKVK